MGKLIIDGTLDLAQFWPEGEADADTTKLIVDVTPDAIRYQPDGAEARPTRVYENARVKTGGTHKPVISKGKLTVRLQGIDAPELHLQPQSMKGRKYKGLELGGLKDTGLVKKYRQHQAETATVRLAAWLGTLGASPLPCRFTTEVLDREGPSDAIDKYGRFVGNVQVGDVDVNLEILRRGLAVIALYNSMQRGEIELCLEAWREGRKAAGGIARYLDAAIGEFDASLLYRRDDQVVVKPEGARRYIHPKIFRRQCSWWTYRKLGTFKAGLDVFLGLSPHDVFFVLQDFLNDAPYAGVQLPVARMIEGGRLVYRPDEVIFKDAPSALYVPDGRKLTSW